MNWLMVTQLLLALANGLVSTLTKQKAPAQIIADAQAAADALAKVAGSDVTAQQLNSLTFTPQW